MLDLGDLLREMDLRLVAGAAGADHPVRWVHISELPDPTPFLSGGELLLTTGMQLTDPEEQRAYVARLAEHGLAGIGLGTGFAHAGLPEAVVAAAGEHGFALFEVPYEVPFIAVTEKAFSHLVNEHYAVLQRALSAHERLERIVLSERRLEGGAGGVASPRRGRRRARVAERRRRPGRRRARRAAGPAGRAGRARRRDGGRRLGGAARAHARGRPARLRTRRPFAGPRAGPAGAPRRPARGQRRRRRAAARGLAGRGQGRWPAQRVRSPDAASGRDDRRARAAAPPGGRRHGAPP